VFHAVSDEVSGLKLDELWHCVQTSTWKRRLKWPLSRSAAWHPLCGVHRVARAAGRVGHDLLRDCRRQRWQLTRHKVLDQVHERPVATDQRHAGGCCRVVGQAERRPERVPRRTTERSGPGNDSGRAGTVAGSVPLP